MWAFKGRIVYSRLNYCKVKITENSGTEWDEIALETVWKIDKKALKKIMFIFIIFSGYIFEGTVSTRCLIHIYRIMILSKIESVRIDVISKAIVSPLSRFESFFKWKKEVRRDQLRLFISMRMETYSIFNT